MCGCIDHKQRPIARPTRSPAGIVQTGSVQGATKALAPSRHEESAASPQAVVYKTLHDFKSVEPYQTHTHIFRVYNQGALPLELEPLGTTCKCVTLTVADRCVEPGKDGRVVVAWNARANQSEFLQTVSVRTNDPDRALIDLKIGGHVRSAASAVPDVLRVGHMKPGTSGTATAVVVSQVWDAFAIEDVEPTLDRIEWQVAPADADELRALDATSGWYVSVTLPDDLPSGEVHEMFRFNARQVLQNDNAGTAEPADSVAIEIPIYGRVTRSIGVYGKGINPEGIVDAGVLDTEIGYRQRFLVKVYDPDKELVLKETATQPGFIKARLKPYAVGVKPGFYHLDIEIPASGKPGVYRGNESGSVRLYFDHPRITNLEIKMEFVVRQTRSNAEDRPVGLATGG